MKVSIDDSEMQKAYDLIRNVLDDTDDQRFYSGVAKILLSSTITSMETEGKSIGKKWTPLAQSTIEQRLRKGKWPGKMLQVTGELKTRNYADNDNNSATITNNTPYAKFLFFGTKNMPARPWLGLDTETETRIIDLYIRLLKEKIEK